MVLAEADCENKAQNPRIPLSETISYEQNKLLSSPNIPLAGLVSPQKSRTIKMTDTFQMQIVLIKK
jgi:hypothetical protein